MANKTKKNHEVFFGIIGCKFVNPPSVFNFFQFIIDFILQINCTFIFGGQDYVICKQIFKKFCCVGKIINIQKKK